MTPHASPQPGFIAIRDARTLKLVCWYNVSTGEVLVNYRGDERRATLPIKEPERVARYVRAVQGE